MLFQIDSNATVSTLPTPPNSPYTNRDNNDKLICETPFEYLPLKTSALCQQGFFFNLMKYWWQKRKIFTWASASVNEPSESGSSSEWDSRSATETLRSTKKKSYRRFTLKCWKSFLWSEESWYLQAICINIQLQKHLSHSSLVLLHADDLFLFWK